MPDVIERLVRLRSKLWTSRLRLSKSVFFVMGEETSSQKVQPFKGKPSRELEASAATLVFVNLFRQGTHPVHEFGTEVKLVLLSMTQAIVVQDRSLIQAGILQERRLGGGEEREEGGNVN